MDIAIAYLKKYVAPFGVDEALAVLPLPEGGRSGWLAIWGREAKRLLEEKRMEDKRREFEAARQAEEARREARKLEPIWAVISNWGIYSWAGCLYGYKVVEGPVKGSDSVRVEVQGLTHAEASAKAGELSMKNEKAIKFNREVWHDFINS